MKIGLWSDSVNFPNLPLMKLSAFHKQQGDSVEFIEENGHYDKVYLSKVFNLPLIKKIPQSPPRYFADQTEKGGTGYAIKVEDGKEVFRKELHKDLPRDIETMYPDYDLYPQFSKAYSFLTRGCCNNCSFCIVSKKEGRCSRQVAELSDFWRGQEEIKLLDPNILAAKNRESLMESLLKSNARIDFTQGLDARFVNESIAKILQQMKIKAIHFAFDFMRNEQAIIKGLECFNRFYTRSKSNIKCYILTNFDTTHEEDWYRVRRVRECGIIPDIRIYQKGTHDRFLTDLQRWCNNIRLYRSTEFEDYVPRVDGKTCRQLYPEILKKEICIMPTKKTNEQTAIDTTGMNVWSKLLAVRNEFYAAGAKKTGKNLHAEFMYFELSDIVPVAAPIFAKYNLLLMPTFENGNAEAVVINTEKPNERINFSIPLQFIAEPGKFRMNEVQGVGAAVTYYRRYLYMIVLDLVEADSFDGENNTAEAEDTPASAPKKKPATTEQRQEIKKTLTNSDGEADDLQKSALKAALKKLKEIDPSKEEFIRKIAIKTEKFTSIKKAACEQLILTVNEMIENYGVEEE